MITALAVVRRPAPGRARRLVALAGAALALLACASGGRALFDPARHSIGERLEHTDQFWGALANLDVERLRRSPLTVDEHRFLDALDHLMEGRLAAAESSFRELQVAASDTLIREAARISLTATLQYRGAWSEVTELPRDATVVALSGTGRAAVELWAGTLRDAPTPQVTLPAEPVVLRMEPSPFRTPMVTGRINGVPVRLWLDTGATISILSERVAGAVGLAPTEPDTLAVLSSTAEEVAVVPTTVARLELGGITVRDLPAMIVRTGDLSLPAPEGDDGEFIPIDAILGADVLRYFDFEIDAAHGRVTLRDPARAPAPRRRNLFWLGYPVVRLESENGTPVFFGLDTGAQETYLTPAIFREGKRRRVALRRIVIGGVGGTREDRLLHIPDLVLQLDRRPLRFTNLAIRTHRRLIFLDPDGVLGSDVNRAGRVRIDLTNGVFAVLPPRDG